jgi:hypothetical protein
MHVVDLPVGGFAVNESTGDGFAWRLDWDAD